jgi:hypothetical protein
VGVCNKEMICLLKSAHRFWQKNNHSGI